MPEQTILTWNVTNWITVLIMVGLGFCLIGFATKLIQQRSGASAPLKMAA